MATNGEFNVDACFVCLEPFTDPRFLSCHHTYCAGCIQDLADKHGSSFPCPACRKITTLPQGGVIALQKNFYLQTERRHGKAGTMCAKHETQKLEYYCDGCAEVICSACWSTSHDGHCIIPLRSAVQEARVQLMNDQVRIALAVNIVIENITAAENQKQEISSRKESMENAVRESHKALLQDLDTVQSASKKAKNEVDRSLQHHQDSLQTLLYLQHQLNHALTAGSGSDVMTVAKEMKSGCGSAGAVEKLTKSKVPDVSKMIRNPVSSVRDFCYKAIDRKCLASKIFCWYLYVFVLVLMVSVVYFGNLGTVVHNGMIVTHKLFDNKQHNATVFSLCPSGESENHRVFISYEQFAEEQDAPVQTLYNFHFIYLSPNDDNRTGKVSFRQIAKDGVMYLSFVRNDGLATFSKSLKAGHFGLNNDFCGTAELRRFAVTCMEDPFMTEDTLEFVLSVGPHRALDVDSREQAFVVVEEGRAPGRNRSVLLFRRPDGDAGNTLLPLPSFFTFRSLVEQIQAPVLDAVSRYRPPTRRFQPSDVCFYTVEGEEMLLIADEANNAIHVVRVEKHKLTFVRYLIRQTRLVHQPTAMNVDTVGRLWVAGQGPWLSTFEPCKCKDKDYGLYVSIAVSVLFLWLLFLIMMACCEYGLELESQRWQ
jgi:hypothetical protein